MKTTPAIILDLETTGLSASRHKITEIAAIKSINGKVVDRFESLVNPERHIPSFITRLTGISDGMVKDAPTIDEVLPEFKIFLGSDMIVAHNSTFDYGFLRHNFLAHSLEDLPNQHLCTAKLARRVLKLPSVRLEALREFYNIPKDGAHRAMNDVLATKTVFDDILSRLAKHKLTSAEEILLFQHLPKSKVYKLFEGNGYATH